MKASFYGMRVKQVSLVLIALVCITIAIWAWERTPLLTSLLPPQSQLLHLSPAEILLESPVIPGNLKPDISVNNDVSKGEEMVHRQEKKHVYVAAPVVLTGNFSGASKAGTNIKATPNLKEVIDVNVTRKDASKQILGYGGSIKQVKDIGSRAPITFTNMSSSMRVKDNTSITKPGCNFAKGKWIYDDSRPLYSGFKCKPWLSAMWACRLTQRTYFAYEKLRWQPKDCQMEEFKRSKFLQRMQDKTLAFVGDSLGRQQFQSLMCMATGGEESPYVKNVGREYGLVKARGALRPDGWAYNFPSTNTTILYYWSASLCDLQPLNATNPLTDFAMHLDRPPAFLRRFLHKFDVLVLNTGHHWNRGKLSANRWVMHVGGLPNTNKKIAEIAGAKNLTIRSIVKWVDSQLPKYRGLKAFFRTISPRHFFNGDWNTGGTCDNTAPSEGQEVLQEESSDSVAAEAVKGTKVKLLDITALSQLRDEGHISRYSIRATPGMQDCLHWCLPGVPDTWNELLFAEMESSAAGTD